MPEPVQQGHRYAMGPYDVLALESGDGAIRVAVIDHDLPYPLHAPQWSHARLLKPLPLRYFNGEVPHG
jgi:hypothetical protein